MDILLNLFKFHILVCKVSVICPVSLMARKAMLWWWGVWNVWNSGRVKQWSSSETVMLYKCNALSSLHSQTQMFEKWIKLVKRETAFASRGFLWLMTMGCHIELNLQTSMGTEAMTLIFDFWRLIHSTNHIQCNVQFGRRANFVNSEKIC